MAIFYARTKFLNKSSRNAVHAAAYRRGTVMKDEHSGEVYDYRNKSEVVAAGLEVPNVCPTWIEPIIRLDDKNLASATIWNFAQSSVKRRDAQLAADTVVALPRELTVGQMASFAKEYAETLAGEGFIVDWALHDQGKRGTDTYNPHLHIMTTLRPLTKDGFGPKRVPVLDDKGEPLRKYTAGRSRIQYTEWAGDIKDWQRREKQIEILINKHLAIAGCDERVDCRSNAEKENGLPDSVHIGPGIKAMEARGVRDLQQLAKAEQQAKLLREKIQDDPSKVLTLVTEQKAVFTKRDVYRALKRIGFSADESKILTGQAFKSRVALPLQASAAGMSALDQPYSTLDIIENEKAMLASAQVLSDTKGFGVAPSLTDAALAQYDFLSDEQKGSVQYLTKPGHLKSIVGLAGTGKSTLLKAANEAWQAAGLKVRGVALAGKAAEELKASSGIGSTTLASCLHGLSSGRLKLVKDEVIVLDEAGMVGSRDMATLIKHVAKAEAKLVLTGDPKQLPAISAGAAYRAILEHIEPGLEISTIRRQKNAAHREASQKFAQFNTADGLAVYENEGTIHAAESIKDAIMATARAYTKDHMAGRDTLAISYRNADVRALNATIRDMLKTNEQLDDGIALITSNRDGQKFKDEFAFGDRIVFLRNDKSLGVTNGTSATLEFVSGEQIVARVGDRQVQFDPREYDQFAHGYAVTIHKSQGASVDQVHVLASPLMDRNLTYVAMTRHKESVSLHYDETAFGNGLAQKLGRVNEKTSTLDYIDKQDVIRFGENRGHDALSLYAKIKDFVFRKLDQIWHKDKEKAPLPRQPIALSVADTSNFQAPESNERVETVEEFDWCIPPKTDFAKPVEEVAERFARRQQSYRVLKDRACTSLTENFGESGDQLIEELAQTIFRDPKAFTQKVNEICAEIEGGFECPPEPKRKLWGVPEAAQKKYDDELRINRQGAEFKARELRQSLKNWNSDATSTFKIALRDEGSTRKIQSKGLEYPKGELGDLIRFAEQIRPDDNIGLAELEKRLQSDDDLLNGAEKFERNKLSLERMNSRRDGRVRDPRHSRPIGPLNSLLGKVIHKVEIIQEQKLRQSHGPSLSM